MEFAAYTTHLQVIEAAEHLVASLPTMITMAVDEREFHYLIGPKLAKRKARAPNIKETSETVSLSRISSNPSSRLLSSSLTLSVSPGPLSKPVVVSPRKMVIVPQRRKLLKIFPGYPMPGEPYPANFSLVELCQDYPNHLVGNNLIPFLQHKWTATTIAEFLPDQSDIPQSERVTVAAISSRLSRLKSSLDEKGQLEALMEAGPSHITGIETIESNSEIDIDRDDHVFVV